jgi:protein phosphatase
VSTTVLALAAFAATDAGRVRRGNEDAHLVAPPLYAIADGMGGHRGGAEAARLAMTTLARHAPALIDAGGEELVEALVDANRVILRAGDEDDALRGMATTCTAALVRGRVARIAHVGDSRAYLWRGGRLAQLTDDHSVVAQLVRQGHLTADEAAVHPGRNVIFRALGTAPDLDVDTVEAVLDAGDRLLLCSDGLTNMAADAAIASILGEVFDTRAAVDALVAYANAAGGTDNISVVLVDVRSETR